MPNMEFKGLGNSKGEVKTGFDPWKPGLYKMEAISAKWTETRQQHLPQLEVKSTIVDVDGDNPDLLNEQDPIGKPYTFWLAVNPDKQFTIDRLKNFLNAAGVRVTKDSFNEQNIPGKVFWIELGVEAPYKEGAKPRNTETKFEKDE